MATLYALSLEDKWKRFVKEAIAARKSAKNAKDRARRRAKKVVMSLSAFAADVHDLRAENRHFAMHCMCGVCAHCRSDGKRSVEFFRRVVQLGADAQCMLTDYERMDEEQRRAEQAKKDATEVKVQLAHLPTQMRINL